MEFIEVDDSEDQHLMPHPSKEHMEQGVKPMHLDPDTDSGRGSCDSPSLLSEKCDEPQAYPSKFHIPEGPEKLENPETNLTCLQAPQSTNGEGKIPYFLANGPKSSTWPFPQPPSLYSPRYSYHNIADVCELALGMAGTTATLLDQTDQHAFTPSKTIETGGEGKAAKQRESEAYSSEPDQDMAWPLLQDKTPLFSAKPLEYVEIHKVSQDGVLALFPKQNEKVDAPETSKEYSKVSRVTDSNILVLIPDLQAQNLTLLEESAKKAPPALP